MFLRALGPLGVVLLIACGGDGPAPLADSGVPLEGVRPRFELTLGAMDLGQVPWPDDLYMDASGELNIASIPAQETSPVPEYPEALRQSLNQLDGWGTNSAIFFEWDGALDPLSLPETPADSTLEGASVFLVNVDPGSPTAFARVPVHVNWQPELRQLALRPADGHPLAEGSRYAAVVTARVLAVDGQPALPHGDFELVRDAEARPEDPRLSRAFTHFAPVLDALAGQGVARGSVVALASFTTQTITRGLEDARAIVWTGEPPLVEFDEAIAGEALTTRLGTPPDTLPGLGAEGGVAHDSIGSMVHGRFPSPSFLSAEAGRHGAFTRDVEGALEVKRVEDVSFTFFLPPTADVAALPIVLFQHGITADRSDALGLANAFNEAGFAVMAIDAPFHGLRTSRARKDWENQITGAEVPDGFGDQSGGDVIVDFAGIQDTGGELVDFHPIYLSDTIRQAAVDLMSAVRVLRESDLSGAALLDPALAGLAFEETPVEFVGYSLGGIIGTIFTAMEPEVGAAILAVTGGHLSHLVAQSPSLNPGYLPQLFPLLGLSEDIDYEAYHPVFYEDFAVWQTLLDRGDSINYGARIAESDTDVLMLMARHDETVHNVSTEALGRAIGVEMAGGDALYADVPSTVAPVRDNMEVAGGVVTRALFVYEGASHGLMLWRSGEQRVAHPVEPPFAEVDPMAIANPVADAQAQALHFFESFRAGSAEVASLLE